MNCVWISGQITDSPAGTAGRSLLLIRTLEVVPKRILIRYDGSVAVQPGDIVEAHGELGDQEAVVVAGQTVTTRDGRVAMRNVFHARVIVPIGPALQATGLSSDSRGAAPVPAHPKSMSPSLSPKPSANQEVDHGHGPELPWG